MGKTERNPFLDIIKAICILFVIITHDKISGAMRLKLLFPFWIDMAVPMFMIISGYVYAASFSRNGITVLSQAYSPQFLMPKFIRYTVPFIMAFAVQIGGEIFRRHNKSVPGMVWLFFEGGAGPGSYYYPLLLQFLLFYPLLYFIIKKLAFKRLLLCLAINAGFEFYKYAWHCNAAFYRLLLFRYTFIIAFGSWLYQNDDGKDRSVWKIIGMLIGVTFIAEYCLVKAKPHILTYWTSTSFIACLYFVPIAEILIKRIHIGFRPLELIGRASFNIFLTQMLYYRYAVTFIRNRVHSAAVQMLLHIAICISVGLVFYFIESAVTKRIVGLWMSMPSYAKVSAWRKK